MSLFVLPRVAQSEVPTTPRSPEPSNVRLDKAGASVQGVWTSNADTGARIVITNLGMGKIEIDGGGRFSGLGYFDGREFAGVTRVAGKADTLSAVGLGILRFKFRKPGVIAAEFSDFDGGEKHSEVWSPDLASRPKPRAVPAPVFATPSDRMPAFGEYVHVEELPEAITRVPPTYPDLARKNGIEGTVQVQALVGKDGRVHDTRVVRSIPELDAAAVAAVIQWRFKPGLTKGEPVALWVAVPVRFSLH